MNMNKLITLLGLLTGLTANAQLPATTNQFIPQENYAINGGFENGKANWTASAGTFSITSTAANVSRGQFAGSMDFSGTGQTLSLTQRTVASGLFANNCVAEAMVKGFDSNVTIEVYDGTNVIASQALSAYSTYTKVSIPFVCPSSGTLGVRLKASADAAIGYVDDVFYGMNYRVGTVAQAKFIGSLKYAGTASCSFSGTSATYANYSADTDCATPTVTGSVSAPGTKLPAAVVSAIEPGTYKFTISTTFTAANGAECLWRVSDGTNNSDDFSVQYTNAGHYTRAGQYVGFITYANGQGSTTFNLQHKKVSGTGCDLEVNSADHDFVIKIEKLPSNAETVYAPNMQAAFGGARWVHTSGATSTVSSASWTTYSDSDFNTNRTMTGAAVACSNTSDICFKMPKVPVGKYLVSFRGGGLSVGTGATANCSIRIYDGTTSKSANYYNSGTGILQNTPFSQGVFEYTSEQLNLEYKLQAYCDYGSTSLSLDRDDSAKMNAEFLMIPIEQGIPMPTVINSMTTNYSGQMRVVAARIDNNGTATIAKNYDGSVASVSRTSQGVVDVTFATGQFSDYPICTCNVYDSTTRCEVSSTFLTKDKITIRMRNSSEVNQDVNFMLHCIGPKT